MPGWLGGGVLLGRVEQQGRQTPGRGEPGWLGKLGWGGARPATVSCAALWVGLAGTGLARRGGLAGQVGWGGPRQATVGWAEQWGGAERGGAGRGGTGRGVRGRARRGRWGGAGWGWLAVLHGGVTGVSRG